MAAVVTFNPLALRRRVMLGQKTGGGGLPAEYQQVEYLYRSATYSGPVGLIYATVATGDVIETGSKRTGSTSGEVAFAGDASHVEWGYQANKTEPYIWQSTNRYMENRVVTEGNIDTTTATVLTEFEIKYIGLYRYGSYKFDGRIYYLKIKDSSNHLKYNFVPCYRKSDNEPGFYDTVNGTFYPNDTFPGQSGKTGQWEIPS